MSSHWSSKTMEIPGEVQAKDGNALSLIEKTLLEDPYSRILSDGHIYYHPSFKEAYKISGRLSFPHIIQVLDSGAKDWVTRVIRDCDSSMAEYICQQFSGDL